MSEARNPAFEHMYLEVNPIDFYGIYFQLINIKIRHCKKYSHLALLPNNEIAVTNFLLLLFIPHLTPIPISGLVAQRNINLLSKEE